MPKIHLFKENGELFNRKPCSYYNKSSNLTIGEKFHAAVLATEELIRDCLEMDLSTNVCFGIFLSSLEKINDPDLLKNNSHLLQPIKILAEKDTTDRSSLLNFMKLLRLFRVPGVSHIEVEHSHTKNQYSFEEINFPDRLIPDEYICNIGMQVMSAPCRVEGGIIDHPTLKDYFKRSGKKENPFNRQVILEINVDKELASDIKLLLKKAQLVHYLFGEQKKYDEFSQQLLAKNISYPEFKHAMLIEGHLRHNPQLFFSGLQKNSTALIPTKNIFEVFLRHRMHVVKLSHDDFNTLIDKIITEKDEDAAHDLLDSPYVDIARINTSKLQLMLAPPTGYLSL